MSEESPSLSLPASSPQPVSESRLPPTRYSPAIVTLVGGGFLSFLLFLLANQSEENRLKADFENWSRIYQANLRSSVDNHLNMLRFVGALYFSSRNVDRKEFRRFAKDSAERLPAIHAVQWLPQVLNSNREIHCQAMRTEGFGDYEIVQRDPAGAYASASSNAIYYPVVYVWPGAAEKAQLGWDVHSVPVFAEAMKKAIEEHRPIITRMDWTNPSDQSKPYWRAFHGVYLNGAEHGTLEDRQANLQGYVSVELNMNKLAIAPLSDPAMADLAKVALQLRDPTLGDEVVFQSRNWPEMDTSKFTLERSDTFQLGGHEWTLVSHSTDRLLAIRRHWHSWALSSASLLLTILVAAFLFSMANRESKVQRLVWMRTQDLQNEIRQRREAEDKLQQERELMEALMDTTPDHIYFKDLKSRFIRISKAQSECFQLAHPNEAIGKSDFDFFTNEHAQSAYDDEQDIIRTSQPMVGREEKETWPDGSVTWVSTTKQCLPDKQGHIIGTFGISRDITARKAAEQALEEKTEELLRSNLELEQFAYVASHDLQEPLRMIASYTQLLARRYRGKLDQDADEFIGYAVDGASRMQTLINDLLAYSRVDRRGKPFAPTDCAQALKRALENLKVTIDEAGAEIHYDTLPQVMADEMQLTQLFQNLISNAIKFRGGRSSEIRVSAELKPRLATKGAESACQEWVFRVQDNGIGIDPEYFDRIFIIFQRLHTRDQYAGTGIGLAVCKKIVERHKGRIWVESQANEGSIFYFTIPDERENT